MSAKLAKESGKGRGGRPRRATLSEKETLEKARSLGRQNMLEVMRGWVEDLKATKTVFYEGVPVAEVTDPATRLAARKEIADRCGFRFDPSEAPSDVGRALLDIFTKIDSGSKPAGA